MSEQLTQREINWIEGWIDALDADTYAAGILRKLVAAARGAHDAEQRAEQAEGKVEQIRTNVNNQVLTIRKYREQRDEARQEAARLREALERLIDAADPHMASQEYAPDPRCGLTQPITVEEGEELNNAAANARETITRIYALQSAPPASEPEGRPVRPHRSGGGVHMPSPDEQVQTHGAPIDTAPPASEPEKCPKCNGTGDMPTVAPGHTRPCNACGATREAASPAPADRPEPPSSTEDISEAPAAAPTPTDGEK